MKFAEAPKETKPSCITKDTAHDIYALSPDTKMERDLSSRHNGISDEKDKGGDSIMAKKKGKISALKLYYDSLGNTLNVWFDDPKNEYLSEETGDEVILNKNKRGKVIGFEKLNFLDGGRVLKQLPVETFVM